LLLQALQKGSGLRKGNRARGRRGRGNRLSAGNRVAGERFNNHKEFSDVGAVNDLRKSNNFGKCFIFVCQSIDASL